jgi:hypothetical protein
LKLLWHVLSIEKVHDGPAFGKPARPAAAADVARELGVTRQAIQKMMAIGGR